LHLSSWAQSSPFGVNETYHQENKKMSEAKNIHEAINAIMQEVGYVKKQRSAGLNYSYAGEAALIEALRPAMVDNGVYCYVKEITDIQRSEYATKSGTAMVNISLTAKIEFVHAPSGSSIIVTARGEGSDSGDKASNKASTGAYKYALRQTFCIETGDDPDKFASEPKTQPERTQAQPTKTVAEKPAPTNGNGKPAAMTFEQASNMTNSEGMKYGLMDNEKLSNMTAGISKALKKTDLTAEKRAEYEQKREAIGIILKQRNGGK
jgi:hypothetical protein